jgi:Fe2+ transport system protein FeoA
MNLSEVKVNTTCVVKKVNVKDEKTCLRLMELGILEGTIIVVKHKSVFKRRKAQQSRIKTKKQKDFTRSPFYYSLSVFCGVLL